MSAKPTPQEQLAKALTEFNQAKNRLTDAKAIAKSSQRSDKRKRDNQRKILAGAWVLSVMQTDGDFKASALAGLDRFLVRKIDRDAFPELAQAKK